MRFVNIALLVCLLAVNVIDCSQAPNIKDESEKDEDWDEIKNHVCSNEHSVDIQTQIENCNKIDPYYRLDGFWKDCAKHQAPGGSNWYVTEKSQCKVQECYDKVSKSQTFTNINKEIDNMKEEEKIQLTYKRYVCIRKAIGLKV